MGKQNGAAQDEPVMIPLATADDDVDHGLGEFFEPFEKPKKIGDMTTQEVTELRARNKAVARLTDDMAHLSALRAIASIEKVSFIRAIGARVGLGPRDELTVDDESRDITHTGRRRFVKPSEATVTEQPDSGEAAAPVPSEPGPTAGAPSAAAEPDPAPTAV